MSILKAEDVANFKAQDLPLLAKRLENDDYNDPFEGLKDWHLLRAIAFQREDLEDLVKPYLYLLDLEAYDEE